MRVIDGAFELMVCDNYELAGIEGLVKSADRDREVFWDASNGRLLEPGDTISTATLADFFDDVAIAEEPEPAAGDNVAFYLDDWTGGDLKLISFIVTPEMLNGVWGNPRGDSVPAGTCET